MTSYICSLISGTIIWTSSTASELVIVADVNSTATVLSIFELSLISSFKSLKSSFVKDSLAVVIKL